MYLFCLSPFLVRITSNLTPLPTRHTLKASCECIHFVSNPEGVSDTRHVTGSVRICYRCGVDSLFSLWGCQASSSLTPLLMREPPKDSSHFFPFCCSHAQRQGGWGVRRWGFAGIGTLTPHNLLKNTHTHTHTHTPSTAVHT